MALSDTINIDFQVITAGDPKLLIVADTSTWGLIENEPSIIEIKPPNKNNEVVHYFEKGKNNVFNSSNLLISAQGQYNDLSDGIYEIAVKGSPSTSYCKTRYYLKTDKTQLQLDKLYINLAFERGDDAKKKRRQILEIESMIKSGEALVRRGDATKGMSIFVEAARQLENFAECEDCS